MTDKTLHTGRYLILKTRNNWEIVERVTGPAVVARISTTDANELLLTEQYRVPLQQRVIELPAGLVGDEAQFAEESLVDGAIRELEEETGYRAAQAKQIGMSPASAGLSTEIIYFIRATKLTQVSAGGGDDSEDITPHAIAIDKLEQWLQAKIAEGLLIDHKIYAALHWLGKTWD